MDMKKKDELEAVMEFADTCEGDLRRGLQFLTVVQSVTSSLTKDCIPDPGTEPTPDQLRTYFMALVVETSELLQELNWKPWKQAKEINKDHVKDEFADVLAFLGIILVYMDRLGIPANSLATAYVKKTSVNVDRFLGRVEGYRVNTQASPDDTQPVKIEVK